VIEQVITTLCHGSPPIAAATKVRQPSAATNCGNQLRQP
jgi:hypothetical protein